MLFLGCSAIGGVDSLNLTSIGGVTEIILSQLKINDLFVSRNANNEYSDSIFEWNGSTVMWAKFQGDLLAGNINLSLDSISSVRIKAREQGEAMWKTIYEYEINTGEDFNFAENYYYFKGDKTVYEVAIVPVLNGTESSYITNTVVSDFSGAYLCTKAKQYHAFINLSLEVQSNQAKSFITTLGRAKPFAIANGLASYDTIKMNASFIPFDYNSCVFDIEQSNKYRREVNSFLTNNKPIILKTEDGDMWMVSVDGSIPQSPSGHKDNIVYSINFTEVGDPNSTTDLYVNGFSDVNIEGT